MKHHTTRFRPAVLHLHRGHVFTLIAGLGLIGLTALAQPPREGAPRERQRARHMERPTQQEMSPHVREWMASLREVDPEEYERLREMRENAPVAFRVELRRRITEARTMDHIRAEHPGFYEYLSGLDREERDRLGQLLHHVAHQDGPPRAMQRRMALTEWENNIQVRAALADWQAAETEEEAEERVAALREAIAGVFDERTEQQRAQIAELEQQVGRLQELVSAREERREHWIDRIMQQLTSE